LNDQERIADLEAQVQRLERDLAQMQRLRRDAVAARNIQAERLRKTREKLEVLQGRRTVRVALGVSNRMRPFMHRLRRPLSRSRRLLGSVRSSRRGPANGQGVSRSSGEERELAAAIRSDLTAAAIVSGRLVSIVIVNRDGRALLQRGLAALAQTTYRDIEIIVVDDASTDGSAEFVEGLDLPIPVRVIRNDEETSFSEATHRAAAIAQGELICFLHHDVEPITDDWLGYMVETVDGPDVVAVGARLVYPSRRGPKRGSARFADLTLQHRGVTFDRTEPIPMPRVMGGGEDPRADESVEIADRPALSGACLLVRKPAFDAAGGFASEYDLGLEDIDLCLNLRAGGGRLVYDGRAALWHHESETVTDPAVRRRRSRQDREAYLDDWGPRIFRDALLDALECGDRYSSDPFHIAILGTVPADLGPGLSGLGWRVSRPARDDGGDWAIDPSVEAILVADDGVDIRNLPARLISLAWLDADPGRWVDRPWFDDYDIVLAPETATRIVRDRTSKTATVVPTPPTAISIRDALARWGRSTRYGIRIGAADRQVSELWGDYHFARALQRSLERTGHPSNVHLLPDWEEPIAAREDVTVHLFGFKEAPTRRSQVNLLWQISHPDLASPELYERYDHAFVASDRFAARMAGQTTTPVTPLHQATDPERFKPEPLAPAYDLLFVGNSRNTRRRIVDDVLATGHEIAVFGSNWRPDLLDPQYLKAEGIPNAELNRYYSSAAIVLNDHWNDMVAEGFISNRLYDALACGAFVISDYLPELDSEFDHAVVAYSDRNELGVLIDRYLADPEERRRLGARGRAAVLAHHTFDARAAVVSDAVESLLPVARSR